MKFEFVFVCLVTLLSCGLAKADDARPPADISFNQHIRPILTEYCFSCHGPDSGSRKADLRLDRRDSAVKSGAVVPGDAGGSELVARITSDDPELVMPPLESQKILKPEHKQLLTRWISDGAEYQKHWSFLKPVRAALPRTAGGKSWASNAIDEFILEKLDELKLEPNGAADRYETARRAAFDVTGLPPTNRMLTAFVTDSSDTAWENYIDQLLMSEHAGEHRARYWLDAARYGDTHGMHVDNYREIWPYRDWVIRAFNRNMPFDQFVIEQIAGDLLPEPTHDQLIATGFNRCNITTSEGGAIPEEVDVRYMVDRVETTATVFLGLTAGCAVCHDHKYDPISQREFYQLGAFFNNTTTPAMDGNQKDTPPVVTLPDDEFAKEWQDLLAERKGLLSRAETDTAEIAGWWSSRTSDVMDIVSSDKLILSLPLTEDEQEMVTLPETASWATDHPAGRHGIRFGEGGQFTKVFPAVHTNEPLTISFWYRTPDRLVATTILDQTRTTEDEKTLGWKVSGGAGGNLMFEFNDGTDNQIRGVLPGEDALKPRSWQHVCIRYSGGQSNSSITILVNGRVGVLRNSTEKLLDVAEVPAGPLKIGSDLPTGGLSDLQIYRRWMTEEESGILARAHEINLLLQAESSWESLSDEQQKLVESFYLSRIHPGNAAGLRQYAATQRRRDFIYSRSTTTLVMQERPSKPRAWILERGEYDQRREEVQPWVPTVLNFNGGGFERSGDGPDGTSANRLALAQWLAHPDHPLTARVMVNRLWQSIFGTGLVSTAEDFGIMGSPPSHPGLLDWLAVEFIESGWNINHILKMILMSSAYQQSCVVTAENLAKDPGNRYLSRGPRLRLDAEMLRDQALAVSGLLRRDMGGPGVKPYQPAGLWKVVAIVGSNTRIFERDSGAALYRRSVYSFWKRTSPPPSMSAFDAPTREQCTVRRERTNTPMQALVMMNDPQFVECARRLGENAVRNSENDTTRAEWMLKTVLSCPADSADLAEITDAAGEFRSMFEQNPEAAKELISTGDSTPDETVGAAELAAWTLVANTLMNRDDFVNK